MSVCATSFRVPSSNPATEAFVDLTYRWLDELKIDFEQCLGQPYEGGAGVLMACDVLILLHGDEADWSLWDHDAFVQTVGDMPGFAPFVPSLLLDLLPFLNLHTRRGRIPVEAYEVTRRYCLEHAGVAA